METQLTLDQFAGAPAQETIDKYIADARLNMGANMTAEVFKFCHSTIDLTTLSCEDSEESVQAFVRGAVKFCNERKDIPSVASICVYPPFVETVGVEIDGMPMKITAVSAGFPASQTFLEVKALETAMAVESGADEIDIVINVGKMLKGHYEEVMSEIELIEEELDDDTVLKVIIESGALKTPQLIYDASMLAMMAGTNFVKTSTGKIDVAATPESVTVIALAIKEYFEKSGERIGIKIAGGVRTAEDSALYYTLVRSILGDEWLTPELFRIGASGLAGALVAAIDQ
ncbi:MAG: deoxyribose-phosphate aldolase [Rikenellaceae bacterium]